MNEPPNECSGCGAAWVELEHVDLGRAGLPEYSQQVYHMEAVQWWCSYCMVIPVERREKMEPSFVLAAMFNELERHMGFWVDSRGRSAPTEDSE